MKQQNSKWMLRAFAVVAVLLLQPLRAEMLENTMTAGATDCSLNLQSNRRSLGEWPEMVCAENPNEYFHGRRAAVPTADKPVF
jgi:hypothetical protein